MRHWDSATSQITASTIWNSSSTVRTVPVRMLLWIYYDRTSVKEKPDNKLVPVADIAEGLNADGETVKQLIGIVEGKEVVYTAESDEVLAKVEKGDCVRCYFGTGGELSYAEIIYDQSANKTYSTDASYESAYRIVSKPVYEVKNNSISLAESETSITDVKNGGETLEKYFVESKSLYIYRFDSEKMKFNQINAGELIGYKQDKTDYDRLILLTRGATLQGIVAGLALYAERMILIMSRVVAYLTMLVMMLSLTSAAVFADDDVIKINGEDYTDTTFNGVYRYKG